MSEEFSASLRNCSVSQKKASLVADAIRGVSLDKASVLLDNISNKSADLFFNLVKSISSNIENNHDLDYSKFKINEVFVVKSRTLKRLKTRAKGRADRRLKRSSNLFIKVKSI
jgi:large subunit ribosomal protein L22